MESKQVTLRKHSQDMCSTLGKPEMDTNYTYYYVGGGGLIVLLLFVAAIMFKRKSAIRRSNPYSRDYTGIEVNRFQQFQNIFQNVRKRPNGYVSSV
jgi:hypothetical protein